MYARKAGSTSQTIEIFVPDSSSTTGAGLAGLLFNTSNLTAYYVRPGAAAVAITLATQTVTGAWSSGGFKELESTYMKGAYRFDIPDACLAAGVDHVTIYFQGAANMAPVVLAIDLKADVNVTHADGTAWGSGAITNGALADNAISGGKIAANAFTAGKFASGAFDAVWTVSARTLTSYGTLVADIATAVWGATTRLLSAGTNIVLAKGVGVTGFNDITAAQVEAAILDEGDATALLAAIAAKVEEFLINDGDATATLAAIATAVRSELSTELGRMDVTVSSRAVPGDEMTLTDSYAGIKAAVYATVTSSSDPSQFATDLGGNSGYWQGCKIRFIDGANAGLTRTVVGYSNGDQVLTVDFPFANTPNTDDHFVLWDVGVPLSSSLNVYADLRAINNNGDTELLDTFISYLEDGVQLAGTQSNAITFGSGVVINAQENAPALSLNGDGTGPGLAAQGGQYADGIRARSGAGSGYGICAAGYQGGARFWCVSAEGPGIYAYGQGAAPGLSLQGGSGDGHGLLAVGQGNGSGIYGQGRNGIFGNGSNYGLYGTGESAGIEGYGQIGINGDGSIAGIRGVACTGRGFIAQGGDGGILASGTSGDSDGFTMTASGAGLPMNPAAGAGSAPTVEEIDERLSDTHGAGSWETGSGGTVGAGSISWPVTINDDDDQPIPGAEVWVATDEAGTNVVAGTLFTDDFGVVTFMLDPGTYYVFRDHAEFNFDNPVAITVA